MSQYRLLLLLLPLVAMAHPNHPRDSLSVSANRAYESKNWKAAANLYAEAIRHGVDDAATVYNCACSFARAEMSDSAFCYLRQAIKADFTNAQHLQRDEDLVSLHADSRWPEIVQAMDSAQHAYLRREGMNEELFYMMKDDQAARRFISDSVRADSITTRDSERLFRVKAMVKSNALNVAEDYFNAALICQHGKDSSDYHLANMLAKQSVDLDSTDGSARWLVAASRDRDLQSTGRPQIYGTQLQRDGAGVWTMEPMDSVAISDTERARWNVPSLSDARKHVHELNQKDK
jgi:hypothetical protein